MRAVDRRPQPDSRCNAATVRGGTGGGGAGGEAKSTQVGRVTRNSHHALHRLRNTHTGLSSQRHQSVFDQQHIRRLVVEEFQHPLDTVDGDRCFRLGTTKNCRQLWPCEAPRRPAAHARRFFASLHSAPARRSSVAVGRCVAASRSALTPTHPAHQSDRPRKVQVLHQ